MTAENATRDLLVDLAASLFARGFSVGSAGNISVRLADGYLMTPTNSSLGRLDPERLSKLQDFYLEKGIIQKKSPVEDLFTNQFVG